MIVFRSGCSRWLILALAVGLVGSLANPASAGSITFDVNVDIQGMGTQTIGSITATMNYTAPPGAGFVETGTFTFADPWKNLDDCYQFRWYQIITSLPEAVRTADSTKFKDAAGDYTRSPTVPFVDPPAGGYKYQEAAGGADYDPFYENTGPGAYAYPNYDPDRHTLHVNTRTDDNPGPEDVFFETYLVAYGFDIPAKTFAVLAGYSWNTDLNAVGTALVNPNPVQITTFDMTKLNQALANSGFSAADSNAWTATDDPTLNPCPEPSSVVLLLIGAAGLGLRRRLWRTSAARARAA